MRVFAKKILRDFWGKHNDAEQQLRTWYKEATKANWTNPTDIKSKYAKASILKGSRIVLIFAATNTGLLLKLTTTDNGLLSGLLELIINMIKLTQKKFRNYESKSY